MRQVWVIALAFSSLSVSFTWADEASHREKAIELLEVTDAKKMLDQMMSSMEGIMAQQVDLLNLPPEAREAGVEIQQEMMDWFSSFFEWEQMRNFYVDIYVEVFSEEELQELIGFYESPLGQKLLAKMPALMQKSMEKTQVMLAERMPEFQERLQVAMTELAERYEQQ